MRYVFLPAIFVLVGCADSAPTSTDEHTLHSRPAPLSLRPVQGFAT